MKKTLPAFALAALLASGPAAAQERLQVLLDWFVNPDHAPLVVAQARGLFEKRGLDIELIAPADPSDPPKLVAAGRSDIAVSYQPQLHLMVDADLPLARIGTLVGTPLNSLIVLQDGPIEELADLEGKKVGISVSGFEDAILGAMLAANGVAMDDIELINVNFSLSPSLIAGQVDAVIGAYRNFELNEMDIVGHPGRAFFPEEHGVPPFDELIYIVNADDLERPELRLFLDAVEEATHWLMNHPEEGFDLFIEAYPDLDDELNARAWLDTLPRLSLAPAALDQGRYRRFAEFLLDAGLIEKTPPVASYAVDLGAE